MNGIDKVRYSHDSMIDVIIANPGISQNALAAHFGYTPPWVSQIISSDAFQEKLAARRQEIIDPSLVASVEERFRALADRSLQVLQEKLSNPANAIPDNLALKAAELGARGLGAGGFGREQPAPPTPPGLSHLEELARNLVALQRREPVSIVEGQFVEVQNASDAG